MRGIVRGAWLAAFLALLIGLGLFSSPERVTASDDTVTNVLQPGLNLAGWTEPAAPVESIFDAISGLDVVYAWDAEDQWFRWAVATDSGVLGDLRRLTPGMGLWLSIAGPEPFTWTRPIVREAASASLREGWNLVVWAGKDGVSVRDALRDIDNFVTRVADVDGAEPSVLTRGGSFWLELSADRHWLQLIYPPTIEFLGDHSPEQQAQARMLVENVTTYFGRRFGLGVPGLLVQIGDDEFLTASGACGYYAAGGVPRIGLATKALTDSGCSLALAHEYVHGIQDVLRTRGGELAAVSFHEPFWLREGVANHWPAQAVEAEGGKTYADHLREVVLLYSRFFPASLQGMDDYGSYSYELSQLAVYRLASLVGEQALYDFYVRYSEHQTWEGAFYATFGMTTDAFYEDFASYRAEVAPRKARVEVVVLGPSGAPLEGITRAARRVSDGRMATPITTNAEGRLYRWWPDAGSYDLSFSAGDCSVPWTSDSDKVTMTGPHTARLELAPGDVEDLVIVLAIPLSEACP